MRNLKRALSLALASVMLLGMMVVGTSASYPDVKADDNKEAIEVMQLLKVMTGDDKGNFNPDKAVTRNEMAVIMTKLLDLNTKDYAGSCPFTDVPAWAEPFVAACYANKIVAGTSATTFSGDATVTTAQAALMMLKALGYFQYASDFGEDWTVSTVKQASKAGLFDGLTTNANAALTRNDVAQMALNALEADVVDSDGNGGTTIKGEGFEITTGSAKYEKVENTKFDYRKGTDPEKDKVQQLVEKLFGEDVVKTTDKQGAVDKFGRPATKWENKDKDVKDDITVANDPVKVYAGADYDKDTTKDLKDDYKNGIKSVVYNSGEDKKVDVDYLEGSVKGLTVEIYEDPTDDDGLIAVVTEGYVAQIDNIETNDKDEVKKVTFSVYEAGRAVQKEGAVQFTINAKDNEDEYAMVKGLDEDDYFVAFLKPGWDTSKKVSDLLAVDSVKAVEGKVTAMSADRTYNGWIKIDGVKYNFANEYSQEPIALKDEGTYYLYNDYVIHSDKEANKADDEYLFVVRKGSTEGKLEDTTYYAEVVFTDGTAKTVELDEDGVTSPAMGVYSYTYDKKNDTYELKAVATTAETANIEKGKTAVTDDITANSKTVYINVELSKGKFDKATVYTGYKKVASFNGTDAYIVDDDGVAEYVFLKDGTGTTASSDLIFVAYESKSELINDKDLKEYFTFNAVVDGKIVEIMVKNSDEAAAKVGKDVQLFDAATQNSDDVYTKLTAAEAGKGKDYISVNGNFGKAKDEVIKIGDKTYAYTDDVVVYVVDTDGDITTGSINRNYTADADENMTILFTQNDDAAITSLYIVKTSK